MRINSGFFGCGGVIPQNHPDQIPGILFMVKAGQSGFYFLITLPKAAPFREDRREVLGVTDHAGGAIFQKVPYRATLLWHQATEGII